MKTVATTGPFTRAPVLALLLMACGGIESHSLGGDLEDAAGGGEGTGGGADGTGGGVPSGVGGGVGPFYGTGGGSRGDGGSVGSGGAWSAGGLPGAGGNPYNGTGGSWMGYGGSGSGGRSSGGAIGSGGEAGCPSGQKSCSGFCTAPNPGVGCSLFGCAPCPPPPANGYASCSGEQCSFDCFLGYARNAGGDGCEPAPGTGSSDGGADGAVGTCNPLQCPVCTILGPPCCTDAGRCGCPLAPTICG